jgi:hypothetical protein
VRRFLETARPEVTSRPGLPSRRAWCGPEARTAEGPHGHMQSPGDEGGLELAPGQCL